MPRNGEKDYWLIVLPEEMRGGGPPLARMYSSRPWPAADAASALIEWMIAEGRLEPDVGYFASLYEETRDGWKMIAVLPSKDGEWTPCPST